MSELSTGMMQRMDKAEALALVIGDQIADAHFAGAIRSCKRLMQTLIILAEETEDEEEEDDEI